MSFSNGKAHKLGQVAPFKYTKYTQFKQKHTNSEYICSKNRKKKKKYSGSIVKKHLYCDYKDLIPLISHMRGNKPCTYIVWCLMSGILYVQGDASDRKMEGSDYQETKYTAISASPSTPSLTC